MSYDCLPHFYDTTLAEGNVCLDVALGAIIDRAALERRLVCVLASACHVFLVFISSLSLEQASVWAFWLGFSLEITLTVAPTWLYSYKEPFI